MTTRSEIESYLKKLGIEIKSEKKDIASTEYGEDVIRTERYMPITGEKIVEDNVKHYQMIELNKEAETALLDLITQSIISGDMETAKIALEVLQEESSFYKGHRNAAISATIPLDKRIKFYEFCKPEKQEVDLSGPEAAFLVGVHNIAKGRRTEPINQITGVIKKEVGGKEENPRDIEKE